MYARFEQDRNLVPPGRLVDVRYEDLVADPVAEMRRLYQQLDLGDFTQVQPAIEDYAQKTRDYRTNRHRIPPETAERVRRHWAPYFQRYGYTGQEMADAR
jgi:hypothetical protein